ncbi:MAG: hypothetical protein QOG65_477 [Actinomycetota bacterium]|nr:hypothetical protein [Actinomycetota bacterium]
MNGNKRRERAAAGKLVPGAGLAVVVFVVLGFCLNTAVRMPCYDVCGLDIGRMYGDRGIDHAHAPYIDRDLEYPPLIGVVMYAATVPFDHGYRNPFLVNMVLLTGLAAVTTWVLWRRDGSRAWRWALAPPLLVQGLQNWDLLSVATATIALYVWEGGYAASAGLLLGVGTAAKLYPALFVPILAAASLGRRQGRKAAALVVGAVVGFGAVVVPVYARAPDSLGYLLRFHRDRGPDRGSIWYFVFRGPTLRTWLHEDVLVHVVTMLSVVIMGAAMLALVIAVARVRISPVAACALATIVCLASSKIYSPQYDLWIVPFFVLLPVRRKLVGHFYVASFLVFVLTASDDHFLHRPTSGYLLGIAVAYRFVVLLLVAAEIIRTRRRPEPDRIVTIDEPGDGTREEALALGPGLRSTRFVDI